MMEERRALWVVGSVVVVLQAAILAGVAVPAPHTGGDHTAYLALGHALSEGLGYVELWDPQVPGHTKYPPGYPLVLAVLMLLGATTWTAFKTASAAAISGATLAVFAWVTQRKGALAGGALALLLVMAAGWQEASRWILSEPWFLLWTFLALWGADRYLDAGAPSGEVSGRPDPGGTGWLVLAAVTALMAFGVRTAGLPVVAALLVALAVARRWRDAAAFGGVAALVVGAWLVRTARGGEGAYQSEFFMVNPYEPELGNVGIGGLFGRIWTNLTLYVGQVLPTEWWAGAPEGLALAVGLFVALLALWGWAASARSRWGAPELFAPMYGGMILLWPEVWSGDRFLLPLLPLVLFYAGEALEQLARRVADARGWTPRSLVLGVLGVGVLALTLPSVPATLDRIAQGGECRSRAEVTGDVFACHGAGFREFRSAAAWMGWNLPDDAVVLSRKPRILYALGGPRGRTFPFTADPDRFLAEADGLGARYLLLDLVDGMALRYMHPMVGARLGAFCYLGSWEAEPGSGAATTLLGILPPEERGGAELAECPPGWLADGGVEPEPEGERVPLLVRGTERGPPQ
jgi:hypothetical protein